jgi:cell division protein FtsW
MPAKVQHLRRKRPLDKNPKGIGKEIAQEPPQAKVYAHPASYVRKNADFFIFLTVLILLFIGTIMVASSTATYAEQRFGDTFYFIKRQLVYVGLGIAVMIGMMNIDYRKLGKISPLLMLTSIFLLILVLIPGIGLELNNARRWIGIFGQTIQPTEIAKLSMILFLGYSLSKKKYRIQKFISGLFPYLVLLGLVASLVMLEPHFSATVIIGSVTMILLFAAGARVHHFLFLSVPIFALAAYMAISAPYRMRRLVAFLDPWSDVRGAGWQIIQSLLAIGSGGLFGRGVGESLQKQLYIPEPYNDFIFSILAEEFGFLGVGFVILLFVFLIWRGFKVAMYAPDMFGSLLALGITSLIGMQVIINIAVVTSSMPVTGMPLPFFSYGGTSLIFLLSGVGILLNVSRYAKYERI